MSQDTSGLSGESLFRTSQVKTLPSASTSAGDQTQQSIDYIPPTPATPRKCKVARVTLQADVTPPHHYSLRPRRDLSR